LLDAYAEIRRRGITAWPLVLAGGRGWRDDAILEHAGRLGLGDAIRFTGFVPEEEIPLWYNAADFFVYPSAYEGFGLPPLEALACGTPVVASNRSSLPEVLGDAAVLVDPGDTSAIADGMQRMLEDDSLRSRLSSMGPRRASAFSWRRMAEETLEVYRSVASDAP
jgi:glycosyltransferase involved in cell wall biosynthesis